MKYNSVHLIYFSPTHTSAKTAYAIAEGMHAETLSESDITYEDPEDTVRIHRGELTIVAVPVYGGRVAEMAMKRLREFRADRAPVAFIGEHSFSRKDMPIGAGRPDEADHQLAYQFGSEIRMKLRKLSSLTDLTPLEVKGNFPYRMKSPSAPQAPVTDENLCTQCEYCIDVCPVSAIYVVDGSMFSDPATCIKCCACVKDCPEGARTFDTPYTAMLHKNFSTRREPELFI